MADSTVAAFAENIPLATDVIYVVADPTGIPSNKKTKLGNLPSGMVDPVSYGAAPGATAATNTTAFAAAAATGKMLRPQTPGAYKLNTITVPLQLDFGVQVRPQAGQTVTASAFTAGLYQVVDSTDGGVLRFSPGTITGTHPAWWGASPNLADNTAPLAAAAAALTAFGNIIPEIGVFPFAGVVPFASGVGVAGPGVNACILTATAGAAQLKFGDLVSASATRYVAGFFLNGNSVAENPLYFGVGTSLLCENVRVQGGRVNVLTQALQNTTFVSLESVNAAPGGFTESCVVVDLGSLNINFLGGVMSNGKNDSFKCTQSGVTPAIIGATIAQPGKITLRDVVCEGNSATTQIFVDACDGLLLDSITSSNSVATANVRIRRKESPVTAGKACAVNVAVRGGLLQFAPYGIDAQGVNAAITSGSGISLRLEGELTTGPVLIDDYVSVFPDRYVTVVPVAPAPAFALAAGTVGRVEDLVWPAWGARTFVKKTATARNTTVTLAADPELQALIPTRRQFRFRCTLVADGPVAAGLKLQCQATGFNGNVTNSVLTSNVVTLTASAIGGMLVGDSVTVAGVGAPYDGTFPITAITATTFSYAVVNANIAAAGAAGTWTGPQPTIAWRASNDLGARAAIAASDNVALQGVGAKTGVAIEGVCYMPKAGQFQVRWCQTTSNATDVTVYEQSVLEIVDVLTPAWAQIF